MPRGFEKVSFHTADKTIEELREVGWRGGGVPGVGPPGIVDGQLPRFSTDEAAARYFLGQVLGRDDRPGVRGLAPTDAAQRVPDMDKISEQDMRLTDTRLVNFRQTQRSVPIFGSRIVVELNQDRDLVSIAGAVADFEGVSPVPALSPVDGLRSIADLAQVPTEDLEDADPPELTFYHDDEEEEWHLAYFFRNVPAAPEDFLSSATERKSHGHGLGVSPRELEPLLNYLIDAHDGTVLLYYSATPLLDIPAKCLGVGETGESTEFWGRRVDDGFEMDDPMRFIKTFDHELKDIMDELPEKPVHSETSDWDTSNPPAVSAHVNATHVFNFYNSVLMRDGIDDKGMDLVSLVNCTYSEHAAPPIWPNAVWYKKRMWYGQTRDDNGELRSWSQYLDIIAHELTHGVTDFTSDLVYRNQSGALNESFSDIFGVIISNWGTMENDVSGWNWEIGPGLGRDDLPLRDMSDPQRTGDPDHMDDYLHTPFDSGGVHTNSNIHNKAAYNVLTALDEAGEPVFTPREVAVLYYLCLCRLNSLATFQDTLDTLIDIAKVYWSGDEEEREEKVAHIREAYRLVGIE